MHACLSSCLSGAMVSVGPLATGTGGDPLDSVVGRTTMNSTCEPQPPVVRTDNSHAAADFKAEWGKANAPGAIGWRESEAGQIEPCLRARCMRPMGDPVVRYTEPAVVTQVLLRRQFFAYRLVGCVRYASGPSHQLYVTIVLMSKLIHTTLFYLQSVCVHNNLLYIDYR